MVLRALLTQKYEGESHTGEMVGIGKKCRIDPGRGYQQALFAAVPFHK